MKDEVPMVQIFYKNTTEDPRAMYIPNCGISCPLEKLYRIYNDIIPGNFDEECRLSILTMTYEDAEMNASLGKCMLFLQILFQSTNKLASKGSKFRLWLLLEFAQQFFI